MVNSAIVTSFTSSNQMHSCSKTNWIDSILKSQIMKYIDSFSSIIKRKMNYYISLMTSFQTYLVAS